ncbi:MAG: efflux RND transporter permease subunit [Gammaproteobacteria bacterium]|nr:efflux RND transporter permease subunit [Gammaproteobacteria bacterium]
MDLAKFAIEKRLVSALSTLLILFAGYYAYQNLPRFEDPEFIIRSAQIIAPYPGASAEEVAEEVTEVIENAIQQLQGVKEVKSVSSIGLSEVTVEFTIASAKTRLALNQRFSQLRAKISDTQSRLPPNAGPATVYDDFGDVYALYFAITGDGYTLPELNAYAKTLQRELVLVPGVSKAVLTGAPLEVIYVEYSPARLVSLGFTPEQVAQVLEGQNLVIPSGSVTAGDTRLVIRPETAVGSIEAIEDLVIADPSSGRSFRLKDIATVRRGLMEPVEKRLFQNGRPAVAIGISNTLGGNVVEMGDAVKARMTALENERPIGIDIKPISDQSESVRTSVDDFVGNVILALAIVVGTLLIFMGLRSGILMGGILLVTVAGTLFGMYAYGLDMQRISLGALIISLGMLVDNAIVVVEGTLVRVQKGESAASAAVAVVKQTRWPLLGGTIVGFLAFSPIGFSPDNTGEYAGSLFWTITIALIFSWLVAIWLTPYFCTLLLKPKAQTDDITQKEHAILRIYRGFLQLAIRARWITIALIAGLFASAVLLFSQIPSGFFPASTRAQFVVDYFLREGTDINRTTADVTELAEWVRALDGVIGTNTVIGGGHLRFMLTYNGESGNPAYGQILIDVEDFSVIEPLIPTIAAHIEETYLEANAKVWKFVLGPGGGSKIEARFTGLDPGILRSLADQARAVFASEGAVGIKDDWREMVPVVRPRVNESNARRLGLTQRDISEAIASRFDGTVIGVYREGNELHQIIMRPFEGDRNDIADIRAVQVFAPVTGRYIPIAQMVDSFDVEFENGKVRRIDRALTITAQADPAPGVNAGDLFDRIRSGVETIPLAPGYALEWKGEYGSKQEANDGLATTMPFGFGAMVVVVFLLFNAIRQPVIIWLTVPLALIGVVYGLIATGTPLEFMTILGVLSLTGMLIKNAIVLIDQTDTEIADGKTPMSAIVDAAVSRVRPVSLGALTTVLGVIPLLWDPFFRSLAVVIICGLSFATILTLIIVPTLYTAVFRVRGDEGG